MGKAGLAHDALAHHTAGHHNFFALKRVKIVFNFRAVVRYIKFRDLERVFAVFYKLSELLSAHAQHFGQFRFRFRGLLFCHFLPSFPRRTAVTKKAGGFSIRTA